MNISRRVRTGTIAMLLAGTAAGAAAQTSGSAPPQTIPGLDDFNLPASQPRPTPTPEPTSQATPAATPVPTPVPAPVATPTPRATATPVARATPRAEPTATPTPTPALTPAPMDTPAPAAGSRPAATPIAPAVVPTAAIAAPAAPDDRTGWAVGAGLVLLAAAAIGWWYRRGKGRRAVAGQDAPQAVQPMRTVQPVAPPPPPSLPPEPAPVAADRAHVSFTLHPRRAGLNLLSATVEGELLVRNTGAAPATGIRIGATLIGATAGPEGDVAAVFAQPVVRPVTPPFALAPGEERRVRVVVALPRAEIRSLAASGRAMFVPVVAVNALYRTGIGEGQAAQAFAVGVERVDSAKLAPFWLDQPPRMYDGLGLRPYAVAIAR